MTDEQEQGAAEDGTPAESGAKFRTPPVSKETKKAEFENEQREILKTALAAENLFFDGDRYWSKLGDDRWVSDVKGDAIANIRQQFSLFKPDYVEQVLYRARMDRRVDGVFPYIHNTSGIMEEDGGTFLNVSRRKLLPAAEEDGPFPWLKAFFDNIFDPAEPVQRDVFLAWFQRFYSSAAAGNLRGGQAVIIAGLTGLGKTLLSRKIIGAAMGGFTDAGEYLLGKTSFNKEAAETAVWSVDDNRGGTTWEKHDEFANALKRYVANPQIPYHPKFKDATTVTWRGRIVVTCNLDAKSLSILPELDDSINDKLILLKLNDTWRPDFHEVEAVITAELPFFLRWLSTWTPPAGVVTEDDRFGILPYQHPMLAGAAHNASADYQLLEMLRYAIITPSFINDDKEKTRWMTAAEIRANLDVDGLRGSLSKFANNRLGMALSKLATDKSGRYKAYFPKAPRTFHGYTQYLITLDPKVWEPE